MLIREVKHFLIRRLVTTTIERVRQRFLSQKCDHNRHLEEIKRIALAIAQATMVNKNNFKQQAHPVHESRNFL